MAVAGGLGVRGLFCVSYPLHPPGKPEKLRTEHLSGVEVPTLFVSGTRDSFGTPEEFAAATPLIGGPFRHVWIEGGDHSLTRHAAVAAAFVATWIAGL
jgi:predicted alpha/beta-hydrolase family hydrolase